MGAVTGSAKSQVNAHSAELAKWVGRLMRGQALPDKDSHEFAQLAGAMHALRGLGKTNPTRHAFALIDLGVLCMSEIAAICAERAGASSDESTSRKG